MFARSASLADQILGWSAEMYNACLSLEGHLRVVAGTQHGCRRWFPRNRDMSRYDLFKMFTQLRAEDARWAGLDYRVGRV